MVVFSNAAGDVAVLCDIAHLKIRDGCCTETEFTEILDALLQIFAETKTPLKLILNSAGEEVASEHITALLELFTDCKFDSTNLVGTALILTGMQCTMASLAVGAMTLSRPVKVFSREQDAAWYIAHL